MTSRSSATRDTAVMSPVSLFLECLQDEEAEEEIQNLDPYNMSNDEFYNPKMAADAALRTNSGMTLIQVRKINDMFLNNNFICHNLILVFSALYPGKRPASSVLPHSSNSREVASRIPSASQTLLVRRPVLPRTAPRPLTAEADQTQAKGSSVLEMNLSIVHMHLLMVLCVAGARDGAAGVWRW